ncbi:MAG: hypothetical protein ACI9IP_000066 [Arcticibacterium sp.]|jgi:hypothetical protein
MEQKSPWKLKKQTQTNYRTNALAIPPSTLIIFPVVLSKIPTQAKTPLAMSAG